MNMDCLSGIIAGTAATALAAVTIDGASISVELAGAIFVGGGSMVWWMASKFRGLDDHAVRTNERLDGFAERMENMEKVLKNCPATKNVPCP
jgi:hypothetical protein